MALTAQVEQVWRERIEKYLNPIAVFAQALCNANYEGELQQNGTVNIISVGNVPVHSYTGAWADGDWDEVGTTGNTMTCDQQSVFRVKVPDSKKYTTRLKLIDQGAQSAAEGIAIEIDQYIASLHSQIVTNLYGTDADPILIGLDASAGEVRPTHALARMSRLIAENNGDQSDMRAVIPPFFAEQLLIELGNRSTAKGDSTIVQGVVNGKLDVGSIAGFKEIWCSNQVANTTDTKYKVMAGTPKSSITLARGLEKVESGRMQNDFADIVKGLYIYGSKILFEGNMSLGTFSPGPSIS